jgi:nitrous oxide reductase accessory protein NosL
MAPIDGREAWYVLGSDVYGPMGRELIPFEKEADAKEFMKDHAGKTLIRFNDVTPDLIKGLD